MKFRKGFVSNSSSTSFVIKVDKQYCEKVLTLLGTYANDELFDYDFDFELWDFSEEDKERNIEINCERDYKWSVVTHPLINQLELRKDLEIIHGCED